MTHFKYSIEHQITTPIMLAVFEDPQVPSFTIDGIKFTQCGFSKEERWKNETWLARGTIKSKNLQEAIENFRSKLHDIIPKISLISQTYISFYINSFLVHKESHKYAYLYLTHDQGANGLGFLENQKKALELLTKNTELNKNFFSYWNDVVNVTGYSGKLLLMFSALESLVKGKNNKKDWVMLKEILGTELTEKIWKPNTGLRQRLIHGDYFVEVEDSDDYVQEIHNKVVSYFNNKIFNESLIQESVLLPQRHIHGNKVYFAGFIERTEGSHFYRLDDLLRNIDNDGVSFKGDSPFQIIITPKLHNSLVKKY